MKKILTCLLTVLGLNTACGQGNYENADVNEFAELGDKGYKVVNLKGGIIAWKEAQTESQKSLP